MSEHLRWNPWGDDDFLQREALRRELRSLKRWRDDVLWLAKNASPEEWARGIRTMQAEIKRARSAADRRRADHLLFFIKDALPKRVATSDEVAELSRLIGQITSEPAIQAIALKWALKNPEWSLRGYRQLASSVYASSGASSQQI
jgi:hypothetical protein